jgi:hypothetical protein
MFYDPADPDNHKYYSKGLSPTAAAGSASLTQTQLTNSGYATRTQEANDVISGLEQTIAGMNPLQFTGQVAAEGSSLTHGLASEDIQKLRQAERNFVNAVLRRESGAAISESEFENAEKQYFPQPGDTSATLAQKAQNRQTTIAALNASAGGAPATSGGNLRSQVMAIGVDYDALKADGYSDADIRAAIGL